MIARLPRPIAPVIALALLTAVYAASTLAWLRLDRSAPNWDDAWHLTNSLRVYDGLANDGIIGYFQKLGTAFGFKAPLIAALPTPFYLVFGRRWHAAYLVNIASMVVLFSAEELSMDIPPVAFWRWRFLSLVVRSGEIRFQVSP